MDIVLSRADLKEVIKQKVECDDFEIVEWNFKKGDWSAGFFGLSTKEFVAIKSQGKINGFHFFVRRFPTENEYHKELLCKSGVFAKEAELYTGLLNELRPYSDRKLYPDCYLARKNNVLVLEDLTLLGYEGVDRRKPFTLEQIESALTTLSKLHAASIAYEEDTGISLEKAYRETLSEAQFVSESSHPWFHEVCTTINALESVVEAYLPGTEAQVCEKAYDVIRTLPFRVLPSRKFRNVVSHGGLIPDRVLFRAGEEGEEMKSILSGFQNMRYNTPALDVLLALHLSTNGTLRAEHTQPLLVHYYNRLSRELLEKDIDAKKVLTWEEFLRSIAEVELTARAIAVVQLHTYLLPKEKLRAIIKSQNDYREFVEVDRNPVILEEMRLNNAYRKRLIRAINELFTSVQNDKKNIN